MKKSILFLSSIVLSLIISGALVMQKGDTKISEALQTLGNSKIAGSGGSGLFWSRSYFPVHCGEVEWTKTEYFNENGTLCGTLFIENGVIQSSYSGTYAYTVESTGTTGERDLEGWQCMDGWWFCSPCGDPCANPC